MKLLELRISSVAEEDLFDLWRYVAEADSPEKANTLLDKFEESCLSLSKLPSRGHVPKELRRIAVLDFLEIHFKAYRIIYEYDRKRVLIHAILDGRRDMETLLQQSLLR